MSERERESKSTCLKRKSERARDIEPNFVRLQEREERERIHRKSRTLPLP